MMGEAAMYELKMLMQEGADLPFQVLEKHGCH